MTPLRSRTRPSSTPTPASMSYPDDVVRGAWSGISSIAPRYTTGEWPFDGWMGRCLAEQVAADVAGSG